MAAIEFLPKKKAPIESSNKRLNLDSSASSVSLHGVLARVLPAKPKGVAPAIAFDPGWGLPVNSLPIGLCVRPASELLFIYIYMVGSALTCVWLCSNDSVTRSMENVLCVSWPDPARGALLADCLASKC